ncbi:MAG TPA: hypothetical protein VMT95_13835 [Candidatus Binatia bacterium]|nr:hypothetical protein [Candidatus Binatia bacterium]
MQQRQAELNRRLLAKVLPKRDVAIDGLRHPIDAAMLRDAFPGAFHLLYIDAPSHLRWERKQLGGRFQSPDAFRRADDHPVERPGLALVSEASAVVTNDRTRDDYQKELATLLERLRKNEDT